MENRILKKTDFKLGVLVMTETSLIWEDRKGGSISVPLDQVKDLQYATRLGAGGCLKVIRRDGSETFIPLNISGFDTAQNAKTDEWIRELGTPPEPQASEGLLSLGRKMLFCIDVISHPDKLDAIQDHYIIVWDQSLLRFWFDNLVKAINLMHERGWKCITISSMQGIGGFQGMYMYALMEKL